MMLGEPLEETQPDMPEEEETDAENGSSEQPETVPNENTPAAPVQETAHVNELCDRMIEQAAAEAARIIEEGHARVQEEYTAAMKDAAAHIEADREAARSEGKAQAAAECRQQIADCINGVQDAVSRIEGDLASFITGYESDLKWLALQIAQQILSDTIQADQTRLVPLVLSAVRSAKGAKWMKVELAESMAGLLTTLQNAIEADPPAEKVEFKLVAGDADHCVVETPEKAFDASISQQIENLKIYFANEQGV